MATKKQKLAYRVFAEIQALGLIVKDKGHWIELSPSEKVPSQLLQDVAKCSDELKKLL